VYSKCDRLGTDHPGQQCVLNGYINTLLPGFGPSHITFPIFVGLINGLPNNHCHVTTGEKIRSFSAGI
jgi:hypothetical protein